jgi:hypothetical protein
MISRRSEHEVQFLDEVKEESEKDDDALRGAKKLRAPRKSDEDRSAFSDRNPFQSGDEEVAENERRRRKVSWLRRLDARKTADISSRHSELHLVPKLPSPDTLNLLQTPQPLQVPCAASDLVGMSSELRL